MRFVPQNQRSALNRRSAFTLLEVLVVVAIILVLAGGATVYFGYFDSAKEDVAKMKMSKIRTALEASRTKRNLPRAYQFTDQDIEHPEVLRFMNATSDPNALNDPWGQRIRIRPTDQPGYNGYMLFTTNPDSGNIEIVENPPS